MRRRRRSSGTLTIDEFLRRQARGVMVYHRLHRPHPPKPGRVLYRQHRDGGVRFTTYLWEVAPGFFARLVVEVGPEEQAATAHRGCRWEFLGLPERGWFEASVDVADLEALHEWARNGRYWSGGRWTDEAEAMVAE